MSKNIISSYHAFAEKFGELGETQKERTEALKIYFARGGVISAMKSSKDAVPKLVYPSAARLDAQLKELREYLAVYEKKDKEWSHKLSDAKNYHSRHQLLKFSDPLYWQHTARAIADKDYNEDAKKVGLPIHLSADPKWKPMIKMFLNDLEYRKNLVETVQTSIVYKNDKRVAKYADVLQDLRSEISEGKLEELEGKITDIKKQIAALSSIRKWAQEK